MKRSPCLWTIACVVVIMASAATASAQNLLWQQADVNTKLKGKEQNFLNLDAYHSGRLHDLLILSGTGGVLAGSDMGGVWLVSTNGSATPVSNTWSRPDINTLTFGFGNEKWVFAGGSGLYVTDYNSFLPYFSWFDISPQNGGPLKSSDVIYKVTTVTQDTGMGVKQFVVIATSNGVWSSEAPPIPSGPYNWQQAAGGSNPPGEPYSGLAAGPPGTGIVVAGFFKQPSSFSGKSTPDIYSGTFDAFGTLILAAVKIAPMAVTVQQPGMVGYVSLDSCASQANRMYASVYDNSDQLFEILRSDDSGDNWAPLSKTLDPGNLYSSIKTWDGMYGPVPFLGNVSAGGWIKHISVSPTDPDVVSVPGLRCIKSLDGGGNWLSVAGSWIPGGNWTGNTLSDHDDWHVARFAPNNNFSIFAGTDGGLINTFGVGPLLPPFDVLGPNFFYSNLNRQIYDIEFSSNPARDFEGESDAETGVAEGLFSGGTQDNGNIYARMNPMAGGPWLELDTCDGGQNQFFNVTPAIGWALHSAICGGWGALAATGILNFQPFVTNVAFIPPVKKDPNNKKRPEGLLCQARAVYRPAYMKGTQLMYVVGGEASIGSDQFPGSVFGLFAEPNKPGGGRIEWEHLGDLPVQVTINGDVPVRVTTTASFDGQLILSGGDDGNIYTLDPKNGQVQPMLINPPFKGGVAHRILYHLPAAPLCAYSAIPDPKGVVRGAVLEFNGVSWNPIFTPPGEAIQDIQVDELASPPAIYVVTDARVYSSHDGGKKWLTDSAGLPERFHGSQLKIVRYSNNENWIYLTTFGRSVWAANLAGH